MTDPSITSALAGRCVDCGVPFCHAACPLGNIVPEWSDLIWRDDWDGAAERLHATDNFPEITGRLCPAPCEDACTLGATDESVAIKCVEVEIIDRAWADRRVNPQVTPWQTSNTIAVVGSGPSGLAAAQQLTRAGHTIVVFERDEAVGGLLRYGVPEFRLERTVIDRRVKQMRLEGTSFRTGVAIGTDITGTQLLERFDAVVLAIGAGLARDLDVPGRGLAGVQQALAFLAPRIPVADGLVGVDVVVVGDGQVAADCVAEAIRQGAASATRVDAVSGFEGDGDGRVASVLVPGGDPVPAQAVVLAVGFLGPEPDGVVAQLGVRLDESGVIARDRRFQTDVARVFACGDAARGPSSVAWAIAEGRSCAQAVDAWLQGRSGLPAPIEV